MEGVLLLAQGFYVRLYRPVQPMLAQTASSVAAAIERLGRAALEWKLDGIRVQIHRSATDVAVFTRTLADVTNGCLRSSPQRSPCP